MYTETADEQRIEVETGWWKKQKSSPNNELISGWRNSMIITQRQREDSSRYTVESVLTSLGYPDPLVAAREHARMILLGRQSRYEAVLHQLEAKWGCTLDALRARYLAHDIEDFAADDDYLEGKWYADAARTIEAQLKTLATA